MWRVAIAAVSILGAPCARSQTDLDPYAPLALYDGAWTLTPHGGAALAIVNRCRRLAQFFACEQAVNGKTVGLLLFAPGVATRGTLHYRTQFLQPDLTPLGAGSELTIDGDDWMYAEAHAAGAASYARTLNHFSGRDRIHFTQQSSPDGRTWTSTGEGDEVRAP